MDNLAEPSRLFQDLLELEKDFKYNLTLLKIRDSEIERCDNAIKTLHETLKSKLKEIADLNRTVSNLEETLRGCEQERDKEKQICREAVVKLTENLKETTRKLQIRLERNEEEFIKERLELETFYKTTLERKEGEYKKISEATEERLQKEITSTSKARDQMQTLIDENMSLRNKIRQLESQYTSEIYFYKNEFRTLQSTNSNLNSEIECLKKNHTSLRDEYSRIKYENDNFIEESRINSEKIANLIKRNNEDAEENNKFRREVLENENLYKTLMSNNEQLTFDKNQLEFECTGLRRILENLSNKEHCSIPSHNNYEFIVKQNRILQELVKAMRKERAENGENEKRVEKLEELMTVLKQHVSTAKC